MSVNLQISGKEEREEMKKKNKALALFLAAAMTITSVFPATAVKAEDGAPSEPADVVTEITKGEATVTVGEATENTVSFEFETADDAAQYTVQKKVDSAWVDVETVTAGEAGDKIAVTSHEAVKNIYFNDFEENKDNFEEKNTSLVFSLMKDTASVNAKTGKVLGCTNADGESDAFSQYKTAISDKVVVSMDFKFDACNSTNKNARISFLGNENMSANWIDETKDTVIFDLCFNGGNHKFNNVTVNQTQEALDKFKGQDGENVITGAESTGWLNLSAIVDFATKSLNVKVVRNSDQSVVYEKSDLSFFKETDTMGNIVFGTNKGGGVYIDNFSIDEAEPTTVYTYTFTDTDLVADTAYDYRVVGKDAEGTALFATDTVSLKTKASGSTGDSQTGDSETGDSEITGDSQTGSSQTGSSQTGDSQTGSSQTGDSQTGSSQTGSSQTGDSQTGSSQTGSSQTGDSQTGSSQTGDSQTGSSQTGDSQTNSSQTDNSQTNSSQTNDSQTGNSQTGSSQTGDSQTGSSQTGDSQTGSSQAPAAQKVGAKFTVSKHNYKVTKSGKAPTVEFTGTKNAGKTIKIPDIVKDKNGVVYKVTTIGKNAMKGNKKVTNLTIGKHVTNIKDNAFLNCTKLTKVKINSTALITIGKTVFSGDKNLGSIEIKSAKLKTVGKNALKNTKKNIKIKVPKKQVKKYKDLFKNKGQKNYKVSK